MIKNECASSSGGCVVSPHVFLFSSRAKTTDVRCEINLHSEETLCREHRIFEGLVDRFALHNRSYYRHTVVAFARVIDVPDVCTPELALLSDTAKSAWCSEVEQFRSRVRVVLVPNFALLLFQSLLDELNPPVIHAVSRLRWALHSSAGRGLQEKDKVQLPRGCWSGLPPRWRRREAQPGSSGETAE